MIADALIDGHVLLSDWLFLIAAVVFVLCALGRAISTVQAKVAVPGYLLEVGLALVTIAWLVL
jgi:hypothetical protein